MRDDEPSLAEEEIPVDDAEATEADGVAEIEMTAPYLLPDDVAATLDQRTWRVSTSTCGRRSSERTPSSGLPPEAARQPPGRSHSLRTSASPNFIAVTDTARRVVPSAAVPALRTLVTDVLQPLRDRFGRCTVNSGFRTQLHNRHVGGEPNSFHRYDLHPSGPASDLTFANGNVNQWAAEARRLLGNTRGGIGRYPQQNFIHVDLGPMRKWDG